MIFGDLALARRLEAAEAANTRACSPESAVLEIAGGWAVFAGAQSPLSQALGIGLHGPVRAAEVDAIESFFARRGAPVSFDVCPLADASLLERLGERGYRVTEFNTVLVKRLAGGEIEFTPRVRRATAGDADLWSYTVGRGFFDQMELTAAEMDVGRAIFGMPEALCFLAANENGEPAGGAAAAVRHGLALLFADSTIAAYRRRGLQRELIAARLNEALARGCDLAAASTAPGSVSQRNYERMGFRVAYTKVTLVGDAAPHISLE